jgi:menaquinone-9 beta-reductase
MKKYDVVIVGAGPAGATAAYHLARAGVRVCLVDKATFPRDKICGDGVQSFSLNCLRQIGLGEWLAQNSFNAPSNLLLSAPNGKAVQITPPNRDFCYGRVIPRLKLDAAIAGQAVKAGAELLEGVNLTGFSRCDKTIGVTGVYQGSSELHLKSSLVIAADGVHTSFTKQLGLVKAAPDLVAARAYFAEVSGNPSLLEIHYDPTVMPGYGWIFPMAQGEANVGLGTYVNRTRRSGVNLKESLLRFIKNNRYTAERLSQARQIGPIKGYPLRSRMNSVIPFDDNILVAGEAAGLVNPLNGEGIATAMLSGELAARHAVIALAKGDFSRWQLRAYASDLRQQIGRNHAAAAFLRWVLGHPAIMNYAIRRVQLDFSLGQTLYEVIMEIKPATALLTPQFIAKFLAG